MGNCMERCRERREEGEEEYEEEQRRNVGEEEEKGSGTGTGAGAGAGAGGGYGVRVKIMLTKEELEWMMFQLKENGAAAKKKRSLEDLLREIETARSSTAPAPAWKIETWRPSLESIMESPELLLDMDR